MLNIWGRISSINVRKVVWCAQELELDFQRTEAGGRFGIVQTPEYLALNPNAMVPTIDDGEGPDRVTLWESNVIVRYLCARHAPGTLYPELLHRRFDAERWMDWQQTTLNPVSAGAFKQWVRTPAAERDPAVIAQSVHDRAAVRAARRTPGQPRLHARRRLHDGRHPGRLRGAPLVRPATDRIHPARLAERRTLVRRPAQPRRRARRARPPSRMN
jgi:glutathione S-transferase